MTDLPNLLEGEQFDGTADDVVMPDHVRDAARARIATAMSKYPAADQDESSEPD